MGWLSLSLYVCVLYAMHSVLLGTHNSAVFPLKQKRGENCAEKTVLSGRPYVNYISCAYGVSWWLNWPIGAYHVHVTSQVQIRLMTFCLMASLSFSHLSCLSTLKNKCHKKSLKIYSLCLWSIWRTEVILTGLLGSVRRPPSCGRESPLTAHDGDWFKPDIDQMKPQQLWIITRSIGELRSPYGFNNCRNHGCFFIIS